MMFEPFIEFVREIYGTNEFIPLHEPRFVGNEKEIINETIDCTFVSTVGEHVNNFEFSLIVLDKSNVEHVNILEFFYFC